MSRSRSASISSSACSSETGSDPEDFSDWASSLHGAKRTKSLFDDNLLDSPEECLEYDERVHGYNVKNEGDRLELDDYARIRLVNYIRRKSPAVGDLKALKALDAVFTDEANLKPVVENDPLLQLSFSDSWSDDELEPAPSKPVASSSAKTATPNTKSLQAQVARAEAKAKQLQAMLDRMMGEEASKVSMDDNSAVKGKGKGKEKMDIDTHYFDSYASNDIHETMLKDTVRTMSYGEFILNNPTIFKDAIVLDVGCGSGILSMFAARAGAKHVYAIEASSLAHKARRNIAQNGYESPITVIQGKVEEIELPVKEVDVIVSEWMGYMLLYESMLDSVLHARDRFMRPGGLMVPSQTRIMMAGMTSERLYEEGFDFWNKVYGFDLSPMKPTKFEDGIIEVVDAEELVTSECPLTDINTNSVTVPELDFVTPFTLKSNAKADSPVQIRAFLTWFDTFFSPDSSPSGQAPLDQDTQYVKYENDAFKRDVSVDDGKKAREVSFTTGPRGKATHWKQVAFILQEPVSLKSDERIEGTFHCRKSRSGNTRELDVELHWKIISGSQGEGAQRYDVFRVC